MYFLDLKETETVRDIKKLRKENSVAMRVLHSEMHSVQRHLDGLFCSFKAVSVCVAENESEVRGNRVKINAGGRCESRARREQNGATDAAAACEQQSTAPRPLLYKIIFSFSLLFQNGLFIYKGI